MTVDIFLKGVIVLLGWILIGGVVFTIIDPKPSTYRWLKWPAIYCLTLTIWPYILYRWIITR